MALERQAAAPGGGTGDWIRKHLAGLAAVTLGLVAIAVASLIYWTGEGEVLRQPNPWVTTPLLVVTLVAAVASLVRREGVYTLSAVGVGLAAAAMVIGWTLVVGAVALVTVLAILLLHQLM
jgi:hypothetical protein